MKLIRSILLGLIGIVSIIIGVDSHNFVDNWEGNIVKYDEKGEAHNDGGVFFGPQGFRYVFILGGAALIAFAIPTNIKKKED